MSRFMKWALHCYPWATAYIAVAVTAILVVSILDALGVVG